MSCPGTLCGPNQVGAVDPTGDVISGRSAYPMTCKMRNGPLHAPRLPPRYDFSNFAPPQLWEWEQPHIDNLSRSARMFGHGMKQRFFLNWRR